jgi:hypothetical protein
MTPAIDRATKLAKRQLPETLRRCNMPERPSLDAKLALVGLILAGGYLGYLLYEVQSAFTVIGILAGIIGLFVF